MSAAAADGSRWADTGDLKSLMRGSEQNMMETDRNIDELRRQVALLREDVSYLQGNLKGIWLVVQKQYFVLLWVCVSTALASVANIGLAASVGAVLVGLYYFVEVMRSGAIADRAEDEVRRRIDREDLK